MALDVSRHDNKIAVALANGQVFVIRFEKNESSPEWEEYGGNFESVATDIIKQEETIHNEKKR